MNRYAFILGHVPVLSSIEAKILIPDLVIESVSGGVMVAQSSSCDPKEVLGASGGLVKIAREYAQSSAIDLAGIIVASLQEAVPSGKITFGISVYGGSMDARADKLAMQVKNVLKEAGRSVRHVHSKTEALNTATLLFNEFEKSGHVEVCLISEGSNAPHPPLKIRGGKEGGVMNQIGVFITKAFQDLSEYTNLETILGARDDRRGVLPLRLVKMLLNIAEVENKHSLLDPFCGSGILAGVAAARGVNHIFASDISSKAVQDTRKNLSNLKHTLSRQSSGHPSQEGNKKSPPTEGWPKAGVGSSDVSRTSWQAQQLDVCELSKHVEPASIDRIVTEPYLGPSSRIANPKEREELSSLYVDSFREFKKILKPDGKILFIFPVFEGVKDFVQAQEEIAHMGFVKVDFMKDVQRFFPGIPEPIYSRPQQRVKRLITMWELKK